MFVCKYALYACVYSFISIRVGYRVDGCKDLGEFFDGEVAKEMMMRRHLESLLPKARMSRLSQSSCRMYVCALTVHVCVYVSVSVSVYLCVFLKVFILNRRIKYAIRQPRFAKIKFCIRSVKRIN